ncbi:hypothetical protein D3C72_1855820 [compost metagenome]
MEPARLLATLLQRTAQPFGLGRTLAQLPLQPVLLLDEVAGIEASLGETSVQAGMGGSLGDQLAFQLLDLGGQ